MMVIFLWIALIFLEQKPKSHEKIYKNKNFCRIAIPSQKDNILQFNQYMKSDKIPYIIYADLESLIKKIDGYANNPKKSSTTRNRWTNSLEIFNVNYMGFDKIQNKYALYYGEECMKKFCTSLR